jgi:trk system potassium uptake protein TrkA
MKKQFLVIGAGRFGKGIIKELSKQKNNIIVVCDEDERNLKEIEHCVEVAIVGNAKEDDILDELKVDTYDVIFIAIGTDAYSAILTTKKIKDRNAKKIVTKATSRDVGEILIGLGSDRVIYPEEEAGRKIAKQEMFDGVIEYLEITDEISAVEVMVPETFWGKSLVEIDFSNKTGLTVSLVLRKGKPIAEYFSKEKMASGDLMIIVGEDKKITEFKRKFV